MKSNWNNFLRKETINNPTHCDNFSTRMILFTLFLISHHLNPLELKYYLFFKLCQINYTLVCLILNIILGIVLMLLMYVWDNIISIPYIVIWFSRYLSCAKFYKSFLWYIDNIVMISYNDTLD